MNAVEILLRLRRRVRREAGVYSQISKYQVLRWISEDLKEIKVESFLKAKADNAICEKVKSRAKGGYLLPFTIKGTALDREFIKQAKKNKLDVGYI